MPPLRPERKWRELTNSATIDYRCVEFDRRKSTESVAERLPQLNPSKILAFTMAEILLSLTIIGVVAAITLPSLTGNINERTWNTQRKALYARFSQAIMLMPAMNGYGTITEDASGSISTDTAAETFITAGLSKVLKINNICDSDHLSDCGVASKITTMRATQIDMPKTMAELNSHMAMSVSDSFNNYSLYNTKAAAFETQNGETVTVYYNPNCVGSLNETSHGYGAFRISPKVCANFVYDLNGNKGPNTVGKDIGFLTALYPSDPKIAMPYPAINPLSASYNQPDGAKACSDYDSEYRLPNIDELASMYVNNKLIEYSNPTGEAYFWSSTNINSRAAWGAHLGDGRIDDLSRKSQNENIWCVKR